MTLTESDPLHWPLQRIPAERLFELDWSETYAFHRRSKGSNGRLRGRVLWTSTYDDTRVGIAWQWEEIHPNVLAIADPMKLSANIEVLSHENVEEDDRTALYLHKVIHDLPWIEVRWARLAGKSNNS